LKESSSDTELSSVGMQPSPTAMQRQVDLKGEIDRIARRKNRRLTLRKELKNMTKILRTKVVDSDSSGEFSVWETEETISTPTIYSDDILTSEDSNAGAGVEKVIGFQITQTWEELMGIANLKYMKNREILLDDFENEYKDEKPFLSLELETASL